MAKITGTADYSPDMERLEPTTPGHADYFNDRYQLLLNNDTYLLNQQEKVNNQTIQAAAQNLITNILLVDLNDPLGDHNRPGIVTLETNTSGDFPPGCLWGVRETFWHSRRNLTIKVTGVDGEGNNRIWVRSFIDSSGWGKWTEPIGLLLAHADSGDHDGRYYTEMEIDDLLSELNTQIADCLKSVGDGKIVVANAITAQGVLTATDAAFSTLAANITTVGNTRYNTGYSAGVTDADNRANPASNNYKTGYNAGVSAADARVNTSSASYTTGYNNGVTAADNRANASSVNYKTGYNAGYSDGRTQGRNDVKNNPGSYSLYTKSQYDSNYDKGYRAGVTAGGANKYEVVKKSYTVNTGVGGHTDTITMTGLSSISDAAVNPPSNGFARVTSVSGNKVTVFSRTTSGEADITIKVIAYGS